MNLHEGYSIATNANLKLWNCRPSIGECIARRTVTVFCRRNGVLQHTLSQEGGQRRSPLRDLKNHNSGTRSQI
jgi:hypothetical protein